MPAGNPLLVQTPTTVVYDPAVVPAGAKHKTGSCCDSYEPEVKYTCVPEHYIKKTDKWVYKCGCAPLCVPCFWHLFDCSHCGPAHCECPYTRSILYKRKVPCECDACKCVPRPVADCDHGGCHLPGGYYSTPATPGWMQPGFPPSVGTGSVPVLPPEGIVAPPK
jgi:hypothetical protein